MTSSKGRMNGKSEAEISVYEHCVCRLLLYVSVEAHESVLMWYAQVGVKQV